MKFRSLILSLILGVTLLVGCGKTTKEEVQNNEKTPQITDEAPDVVTSPSRVTDEATLEKASKESWIIILEKDVSTNKDVVLEGGLYKADKEDISKKVPTSRVLALYKKAEDKTIEATYTLTTPKLIIKDENAKIEGGTIKGDVYIEKNGVKLEDATIEGNVYFKTEEAKGSFHLSEKSKVTGSMEVK
ncbi:lipoprotein [Clostridium carnis]